ncbi:hypothetical protein [Thauera sinica]|uniref:YubB ferredoxin-like domain-containing protein n=1 Tax=Thauera sinica TaxID=2665146 RepID=A0ABW1ARZ1_9RHOO|nr:hypothetical protein [Thauera sp. K11]
MKTIESLGIYWPFLDADSNEIYQDEVSGLVFYGYWEEGIPSHIYNEIPSFKEIWGGGVDIKTREWDGEESSNFSIEVKINSWPDESHWMSIIERSLKWFVENGAVISWCGTEFSSPLLSIFSLDESNGCAGSIYAAFSEGVGFFCGSGLNEEYQDIDDLQLEKFNKVVRG